MDRKKAPHKLQVEDSKQDDNSIVEMTQAKMDELKIFRGDAVILKGKPSTISDPDRYMQQACALPDTRIKLSLSWLERPMWTFLITSSLSPSRSWLL